MQVIKTPGVFTVANGGMVNFLNGVMGTSPSGEMFYLTNGARIEPLNQAFSAWLKEKQSGLETHFTDWESAESMLRSDGGLDCITLHHGTRNLAQQMAAFPGQSDSVNALPASGMEAGKITPQLPSYSAGNNQHLVA